MGLAFPSKKAVQLAHLGFGSRDANEKVGKLCLAIAGRLRKSAVRLLTKKTDRSNFKNCLLMSMSPSFTDSVNSLE